MVKTKLDNNEVHPEEPQGNFRYFTEDSFATSSNVQLHNGFTVGDNLASFDNKTIRLGFTRKVFGIFTLQLILTMGIIALINLVESLRVHVHDYIYYYAGVSLFISCIILLTFLLKTKISRLIPVNFVLLTIFTLLFALAVAAVTTLIESKYVLYTGAVLLCPCLSVTLYSLQSTYDLKWYGHLLIVLLSVGLVSGIMYLVSDKEDTLLLIIPGVASLLISIYLVIFIQVIMSSLCCTFRMENYVLVAISAYLVVIAVFLIALSVLALAKGGNNSGGNGCSGGSSSSHTCFFYGCYGCGGRQHHDEDEEEDAVRA